MISRFTRLFVLVLGVVTISTLYIFYPSHSHHPSPSDPISHYEAGGIDSEHYNVKIEPDFSEEGSGGSVERLGKVEHEEVRGVVDEDSGAWMGGHGVGGGSVDEKVLGGGVIMPKLENATAKAELGRAAWRVLHLMTLRYPDTPTDDDRSALKSYFHLFTRLYPCGECATEFQALLKEYPPQTSSRKSASLWLCHVHNMINLRLGKEEFDCLTLDSTYDCGCGPEGALGSAQQDIEQAAEITGMDEGDLRGFGSVGKGDGKTHEGSGGAGDGWVSGGGEGLVRGASGMGGEGHEVLKAGETAQDGLEMAKGYKKEVVGDYDG